MKVALHNQPVPQRKLLFDELAALYSINLEKYRTSGGTHQALKTQLYADLRDDRSLYEALKAVYGPSHQVHTPLHSSDEQKLLSDNSSVRAHWSEHFQSLFSANHNVQEPVIHRISQLTLKQELDEPPMLQETTEAIAGGGGVDPIPCVSTHRISDPRSGPAQLLPPHVKQRSYPHGVRPQIPDR